jgi:hypothetical protein
MRQTFLALVNLSGSSELHRPQKMAMIFQRRSLHEPDKGNSLCQWGTTQCFPDERISFKRIYSDLNPGDSYANPPTFLFHEKELG